MFKASSPIIQTRHLPSAHGRPLLSLCVPSAARSTPECAVPLQLARGSRWQLVARQVPRSTARWFPWSAMEAKPDQRARPMLLALLLLSPLVLLGVHLLPPRKLCRAFLGCKLSLACPAHRHQLARMIFHVGTCSSCDCRPVTRRCCRRRRHGVSGTGCLAMPLRTRPAATLTCLVVHRCRSASLAVLLCAARLCMRTGSNSCCAAKTSKRQPRCSTRQRCGTTGKADKASSAWRPESATE